jgi:RNase adaptor protein for sRNA GlmZ degradation
MILSGIFGSNQQTNEMFNDIYQFLDKWLPAFAEGHRHYMTISLVVRVGNIAQFILWID